MILNGEWNDIVSVGSTLFMRFDKWIEAWNLFLTSPLIGLGPLREEIASSTDNFYLYLLVRVGIVGLFIYLLLISFLLRISFLMMKQENDSFGLYFMLLTALILAANLCWKLRYS